MTPEETDKLRKLLLEKGLKMSLDMVKGSFPLILEALDGNKVSYYGETKRGPIKTSFSLQIKTLDDLNKKKIDEFTYLEEKSDRIEVVVNKNLEEAETAVIFKDQTLIIHSKDYKKTIPISAKIRMLKAEYSNCLKVILTKEI